MAGIPLRFMGCLRVRTYQVSPQPLKEAEGWLNLQRSLWERRLHQLDAYLDGLKPKTPKEKKR
jgi:hypothetical protein